MLSSLISGSSGNASIVQSNTTTLLVDCGLSAKRLCEILENIDIKPTDIDAILITHEHCDHITGAGVMSRRFDLPIYATEKTHSVMNIGTIQDKNIKIISPEFEIGDIKINPFKISHDAIDPVGYSFTENGKKYSILTDTGIVTDDIINSVSGSEYVMLEANHDVDMLMYGEYPYSLKKRISSDLGHMSNDYTANVALKLLENDTKNIMLSHLSNNNNTPEIAYKTVENALVQYGAKIGDDINLCVANRYEVTSFI